MIVLGIDPSLSGLGWCVHDSSVVGPDRVIAKGRVKTTTGQIIYLRHLYLKEAVSQIIEGFPEIDALGVESPIFGESYSEGAYGLFLHVNQAILQFRKDVVYFDPKRLKALARMDGSVRRGRMDKADMVDAAKQDTGIRRWNNDEADAYLVARSAARFWEYHRGVLTDADLTPAEKTPFKSLLKKENDRFYLFSRLSEDDIKIKCRINLKR